MDSLETSGCPAQHHEATIPVHGGLPLLKSPYEAVDAVFADFSPRFQDNGDLDLGGIHRNKRPRYLATERAPDYHVESSFTPEQQAYMGITIAALNTLTNGRSLVSRYSLPLPPLSKRIERHFLAQEPALASFSSATFAAIIDLHEDFGKLYPNLLPALDAMNQIAAADGTEVAFWASSSLLIAALNRPNRSLSVSLLLASATAMQFTQPHPSVTEGPKAYEVWCPGEAFAKSILREAGRAAIRLAEIPSVAASYVPDHDRRRLGFPSLQGVLVARIGELTDLHNPKLKS